MKKPLVNLKQATDSAKQIEAIELRYLKDLPFDEIARRLQISPVNARQVVTRALRSLKKWIRTHGRGDL